ARGSAAAPRRSRRRPGWPLRRGCGTAFRAGRRRGGPSASPGAGARTPWCACGRRGRARPGGRAGARSGTSSSRTSGPSGTASSSPAGTGGRRGRCSAPSDPPALLRPAAVVGDGGDVFDAGDFEAGVLQAADGGLPARPRALDQHVDLAHAVLHRRLRRLLGRQLGGERRALAAALEPDVARRGPRDDVALGVGDGDDRVVERALDVGDADGHVLAFALAGAAAARLGLGHYLRTFFFPATVRFGPLRVRAFVRVRWPRTGSPLRWRMPW